MAREPGRARLSVAEARERVLAGVDPLGHELRPLQRALGAVLAEDIASPLDLPRWDNSGMDGFAVRAADVGGASVDAPRRAARGGRRARGRLPLRSAAAGGGGAGDDRRARAGGRRQRGAGGAHGRGQRAAGRAGAGARCAPTRTRGATCGARGEELRRGGVVLAAGSGAGRRRGWGSPRRWGARSSRVVRRPGWRCSPPATSWWRWTASRRCSRDGASSRRTATRWRRSWRGWGWRRASSASRATTRGACASTWRARSGCDALVTSAGISVGEHDYVRAVLAEMGLEEVLCAGPHAAGLALRLRARRRARRHPLVRAARATRSPPW